MSNTGWWGDQIIVYLHADDERRHKTHCEYYRSTDEQCRHRCIKCPGSSHCLYYKVKTPIAPFPVVPTKKEPFTGIRRIDMCDVVLSNHKMEPPSQKKLDAMRKYFIEHGEPDKPIVVKCKGTKYELVDKYLRYYVAKEFGYEQIPAIMESQLVFKIEDLLRREGTRIHHLKYGYMTVVGATNTMLRLKSDSGEDVKLLLAYCVENTYNVVKLVWIPPARN